MTPQAFLSSLEAQGVRLFPDLSAPSGVSALDPSGVVTPDVAAKIRAALPLLLPLIEDRSVGRTEAQAGASEAKTEKSLPREEAPIEFAAWLAYAKATSGTIAPFADWKENRAETELAELGRITEDELARAEELVFAGQWADILEKLQRLPDPLPWPKSKGCFVPDVARWLQLAGERRNRLYALRGPRWGESCATGRALAQDLEELRAWIFDLPPV